MSNSSDKSQENSAQLQKTDSRADSKSRQEHEDQKSATRLGGSRHHVFHNITMHKDMIIAVAVTCLLAGAIGFYAGRYYEQQTRRKFMQERMQNMQDRNGQRQFNRDGFPRDGMMRP